MPDRSVTAHPLMRDGFTAVPNVLLRDRSIGANAKTLYALLLDIVVYQRDEPTLAELGTFMGCGERVVRHALAELVEHGFATSKRRGQGLPNLITLTVPGLGQNDHIGRSETTEEAVLSSSLKTKARHPSGELALAQRDGPRAITKYFVDESRRLHSDPPRRVTGQVAKLVGEMLAERIEPDRIRAGIDALLLKRLHPSTLPSLVHEVSLPRRPQPRRDGGMTPSEIMAQAHEYARRGQ